jgi:hypothetical protein
MNSRNIAIGTAAHALGSFSLAVVWHVLPFELRYRAFGYIADMRSTVRRVA